MDKFYIQGGFKLDGETEVYSAKNSVLALLAASILTDEQVVIHNCPKIGDVDSAVILLSILFFFLLHFISHTSNSRIYFWRV